MLGMEHHSICSLWGIKSQFPMRPKAIVPKATMLYRHTQFNWQFLISRTTRQVADSS